MEIDLLKKYPKAKRNLDERSASKEKEVISTARKFGKDFMIEQEAIWEKLVVVLASGEHCPHHKRARKPR